MTTLKHKIDLETPEITVGSLLGIVVEHSVPENALILTDDYHDIIIEWADE